MRRMGVVIKYRSCGKARYNMKTCFRRQAITLKITNKNIIIFSNYETYFLFSIVSFKLGKCRWHG